jgi:hypothetical protein
VHVIVVATALSRSELTPALGHNTSGNQNFTSVKTMALLDLPLELLAAVVLALDLRDILGCRYVGLFLISFGSYSESLFYVIRSAKHYGESWIEQCLYNIR